MFAQLAATAKSFAEIGLQGYLLAAQLIKLSPKSVFKTARFDRSRIPPQSSAFGSLPALDLHRPPGLVWILVELPPNGHGHWIWDDRNSPPRERAGLVHGR